MQQHSKRHGLLHNLCEKVLKRSLTLCTLFEAPLFTESCDDVGVMGQLVILNQCSLISAGKGDKKCSGELVRGDAGEICIFQTVDDELADEPGIVLDGAKQSEKAHRKPDRSHEETSDDERLSFVVVVRSGVGSAAAKVRGTSVVKIRARDLAPANENAEIWTLKKGRRLLYPSSIFNIRRSSSTHRSSPRSSLHRQLRSL